MRCSCFNCTMRRRTNISCIYILIRLCCIHSVESVSFTACNLFIEQPTGIILLCGFRMTNAYNFLFACLVGCLLSMWEIANGKIAYNNFSFEVPILKANIEMFHIEWFCCCCCCCIDMGLNINMNIINVSSCFENWNKWIPE